LNISPHGHTICSHEKTGCPDPFFCFHILQNFFSSSSRFFPFYPFSSHLSCIWSLKYLTSFQLGAAGSPCAPPVPQPAERTGHAGKTAISSGMPGRHHGFPFSPTENLAVLLLS
jgi:hypothetical protein